MSQYPCLYDGRDVSVSDLPVLRCRQRIIWKDKIKTTGSIYVKHFFQMRAPKIDSALSNIVIVRDLTQKIEQCESFGRVEIFQGEFRDQMRLGIHVF